MKNPVIRIAVALTGLILFAIALGAWINPASTAARLGVAGTGALGLATLRADLGAFFAVSGGLALFAALRRAPAYLTTPLLLIALALAGRVLALAITPFETAMAPPMVAAAVMVAVFATGRFAKATP
jgi:hypothetical protein